MAQQRLYDFGDPVNSPDDNLTREYLLVPGVYEGFGLSVDTLGDISIAAGTGLQPDGVMWREDFPITVAFSVPGIATEYTIVATHDDRQITGGIAVEYELRSGAVPSVVGGVVLGWVFHPGAVPLAASHFVQAPYALANTYGSLLVATSPTRLSAPFANTYSDIAGMGGNVVFTGQTAANVLFDTTYFVVHQRVEKSVGLPGFETFTQHIQFWMDSHRPAGFDFYVNIPGGAQMALQLRDTDLNIVTITGSPITTTTNWETQSITVDRNSGVFADGEPYELRITYSVDVGQRIDLARITARYWPFPT
jgi:hypothetical protein